MEKPEHHSHLPKVTQEDLDAVYLEELVDENHIVQWLRFSNENLLFFQAVRSRAYSEIQQSLATGENSAQMHVRLMNLGAFIMRVLQVSLEREINTSVDGDDADLQP